jgi:hypothetical protein
LVEGIDLPELPHSGWICRFDFRAEVCDPSNYTPANNVPSSSKSLLSIFGSGQQSRKFTRIMISSAYTITVNTASNHGLQSPSYSRFRASSASAVIWGWL